MYSDSTRDIPPGLGLLERLFDNAHQTGFFLMDLPKPMAPSDFNNHQDQVKHLLKELKIIKANDAFAKQYGATMDDVIGLNPAFFYREDPEHGFDVIAGILQNEQLEVITHENNMEGDEVVIKGEFFILRDQNQQVTGCFGIQSDITKEIRQNQTSNMQKYLHHIAEEITLTASFEWEPGMEMPFFSKGLHRILGLRDDREIKWRDLYRNIYFEERSAFRELIGRLQKGEIKSEVQTRFTVIQANRKLKYIWCKITPIFNKQKQLLSVKGAMQDVTDQTRKELLTDILYNISRAAIDLSDFKTFYQTIQQEINRLVDADNLFVAFYHPEEDQLDIQYVTGESDRFTRLPAEGTISKLVIKENCSLLLNNESLINLDERGKIKRIGKSSKTWLGVPLRHGNDPFGVLVVQNYERTDALDEEDQALLEFISIQLVSAIRRMQDSEQIQVLRNSIQQSPISVVITNKDADIEYVNPKFEEVTGYSFEEVRGNNPRILKSNVHSNQFYQSMWDTLTNGQSWSGEMQNRKKNGELFWEQVSISPVKNDKGLLTHYVAFKEDITGRKDMEKDLFIAKEKAEESDRLKTAFLANMSHEVRTPMNGILGFSELLRDEGLSYEEFNRYIDIINSNGNQLLSIIDDIITVANLEIKQLRINYFDFDLGSLLRNVKLTMEMEQRYMSKTGIKLIFPEKLNCTTWIKGDQSKIQQVLINLLKNALKFTHEGSVELTCRELPDNIIEFSVTDTGIGIPENMLSVIFDRFRQVDDSNTRSFGGTGLGLAISKGLIELLGGEISVRSQLKKGSVFTFTFPYRMPEESRT